LIVHNIVFLYYLLIEVTLAVHWWFCGYFVGKTVRTAIT